jgi:hypothetical protein
MCSSHLVRPQKIHCRPTDPVVLLMTQLNATGWCRILNHPWKKHFFTKLNYHQHDGRTSKIPQFPTGLWPVWDSVKILLAEPPRQCRWTIVDKRSALGGPTKNLYFFTLPLSSQKLPERALNYVVSLPCCTPGLPLKRFQSSQLLLSSV